MFSSEVRDHYFLILREYSYSRLHQRMLGCHYLVIGPKGYFGIREAYAGEAYSWDFFIFFRKYSHWWVRIESSFSCIYRCRSCRRIIKNERCIAITTHLSDYNTSPHTQKKKKIFIRCISMILDHYQDNFIYIDALHERWKGTPHQKPTVSDCHGGTTAYKLDAMHKERH